ncbi:nucleotide exchange factor GrpE [Fervidibacter sacchari]|uniref:Protein GrpE n=1 Tax=Candidatus Fervidibacter sacchari TaxID=1448929 RepID=A0ABT2EP78_9BACT|nr:nucleotide exchange factor GrpE [Candidatus Fervidibacter sacchari]MCS3919769.1 molecular chaperone GrpE [Candidatus Fervidibacter sacchari]WKU16985.1 nucleotide exchange factor GrpE [Candidatus Fervidibacter sacchari]
MDEELKQAENLANEDEEPVAETSEPTEATEETVVAEREPSVEELKARIAELEEQLAQAKAEAEDYKERWIRVSADFQNFRKRVMQERVEAYNKGKEDAVLAVLPVLDNMERALSSLTETSDLNAFKRGLELIVKLFQEALRRLDVEPIRTEGQKFDPYYHEAFERVEREDVEEGLIVGEVERGYKMGDKVIRPAKVYVAVKPAPQLAAPQPAEGGETECTDEV